MSPFSRMIARFTMFPSSRTFSGHGITLLTCE